MAREWRGRLALVALGLALGVAALELALAAGAWVNRRAAAADVPARALGYRRVLALGDSNTFGLGVARAAAYPQVLERLWNGSQRTPGRLQVLNAGYPGMSSSRVRNNVGALMEAFRPDVVLLMVGANDAWTVPEPIVARSERTSLANRLWEHSRVYRLGFMLRRALERPALELVSRTADATGTRDLVRYRDRVFEVRFAPETPGLEWRAPLRANLEAIAALVRRYDAALHLLTYPATQGWVYPPANQTMRDTARATPAPLIDVNADFAPSCAPDCPALLLRDHHPTARGHLRVARRVLHELVRPLRTAPGPQGVRS